MNDCKLDLKAMLPEVKDILKNYKTTCKNLEYLEKKTCIIFENESLKESLEEQKNKIQQIFIALRNYARIFNFSFHASPTGFEEKDLKTIFKISKIFQDKIDLFPKSFCVDSDAKQYVNPLLLKAQSNYFKAYFDHYQMIPNNYMIPSDDKESFSKEAISYVNDYLSTGKLEKLEDFKVIFDVIKLANYWAIPRLIRRLPEIFEITDSNILPLLSYAITERVESLRDHLLTQSLRGFRRNYASILEFAKEYSSQAFQDFFLKGFLKMLKKDLLRLYGQSDSLATLSNLIYPSKNGDPTAVEIDQKKGKEKEKEVDCEASSSGVPNTADKGKEKVIECSPGSSSINDLTATVDYLNKNIESFDEEYLSSLNLNQLIIILKLFPEKIQKLNFSYFSPELLNIFIPLLPSSLKAIDLSHTNLTKELLDNLVKRCPNLQDLNLYNTEIKETDGVEAILSNLKILRSLDIRCCRYFTTEILNSIVNACSQTLEILRTDEFPISILDGYSDKLDLGSFITNIISKAEKLTYFEFNYPIKKTILDSLLHSMLHSQLPQQLVRIRNAFYDQVSIFPFESVSLPLETFLHFPKLNALYLDSDNGLDLINFAEKLLESPTIKKIYLLNSIITGEGLLALILKCPNLEILKLSGSSISESYMNQILEKLSTQLKVLHIDHMPKIGSPLKILELQNLKELSIGHLAECTVENPIYDGWFSSICRTNKYLSSLRLYGNDFSEQDVAEGLSYLSQLKHLTLEYPIEIQVIKALGKSCPHLTRLKLIHLMLTEKECEMAEDDPFWKEYAEAFCSLKNLEILEISSNTEIPENSFIEIIKSLPKLHTLKFDDDCWYDHSFYESLAEARPEIKIYRKHFRENKSSVCLQSTADQINYLEEVAHL